MKYCHGCQSEKPRSDFHRASTKADGLQSRCKQCMASATSKWLSTLPGDYKSESYKAWAASKGTDYQRNRVQEWRSANPERNRALAERHNSKRRALKKGSTASLVTARDLARITAKPCLACGTCESITIEHLVPLARGGRHSIGNLAPLCQSCNSSKGSMLWVEWKHSNRPRALEVFTAA